MALDYPFLNISDMLIPSSGASPSTSTDSTSISSSGIVSSSLLMTDGGLDAAACGPDGLPLHINGWSGSGYSVAPPPQSSVYSSPPPHLQLSTPDNSPPMAYPNYPPPQPPTSSHLHIPPLPPMADIFFCGSSLEESPISSPGDLERENSVTTSASGPGDQARLTIHHTTTRSCSPMAAQMGISLANFDSTSSGEDDMKCTALKPNHCTNKIVPDGIKMPQRKGGMQLWQFLYSMLNDKDGKYRNLIEWTHTAKERQFRLLEPDAIAVWWGHHKNKPNMSYDKLSRSLRYYYDKGIIRKISGERFVYRFCIDPEIMYKHMGTSNARPQLKPMPQDAKVALSSKDHPVVGGSPCIAVEPEALPQSSASTVEHITATYPPPLFPQPPTSYMTSLSIPASTAFAVPPPTTVATEMRRCHSFDSTFRSGSAVSPVQTPSPTSYDGFYRDFNSVPLTFSSNHSSPNPSPPQSATLAEYPHLSSLPPPLTLPPTDHFTTFSLPPLTESMAVTTLPPFTSSYQ